MEGVPQLNHGSYSQVRGYSQAPMNTGGFIKGYIVEEPEGDDSPVQFPQPQISTPIHGRPSHLLHSQSGPSMQHPPAIRPEPQHMNTEPPHLPSYIGGNDVTVEDYDREESEETAPESRRDDSQQWEK
ncbi:hypothetical protein NLJ89_g9864 [Agrocybe chaxingu]|uniref:Uncharacterized protein n=1 Tax=Agrocybe chaxingu TaxID=84603 RepID=A0A9W8MRF4_9AGAR|nr:hypothetical protein NLJ89_g9864 [Agrocybe chaxingu]